MLEHQSESDGAGLGENGRASIAKDKECPFCHATFTASSLGRHLDLFIRETNPKPADGIHILDEIRQIRNKITRRQPKKSTGRSSQQSPGPVADGSPVDSSGRESETTPSIPSTSPPPPPRSFAGARPPRPEWQQLGWEQTGVMRNLPPLYELTRSVPPTTQLPGIPSAQRVGYKRRRLSSPGDTIPKAARLAMDEVLSNLERLQPTAKRRERSEELGRWPLTFNPFALSFPKLVIKLADRDFSCMPNFPNACSANELYIPGRAQYEHLLQTLRHDFYNFTLQNPGWNRSARENLPLDGLIRRSHLPNELEALTSPEFSDKVIEHVSAVYQHWARLGPVEQQNEWNLALMQQYHEEHQTARTLGAKLEETEARLQLMEARYRLVSDVSLHGAISHSTTTFIGQNFEIGEDEIRWNEKMRKWAAVLDESGDRGVGYGASGGGGGAGNTLGEPFERSPDERGSDGMDAVPRTVAVSGQTPTLPALGDGYMRPKEMPSIRIGSAV